MKQPIVIISYKSITLLEQCLSNLGNNREIIIVENSDEIEIKEKIEKKFKHCRVIINYKNFGYGKAANIGFKEIKTKYAFIIEPDIIINEDQLNQIENEISNCEEDFALATPLYNDLIDFNKNNEFDKDLSEKNLDINNTERKTKIDLIKGCSLIVNLDKFKDKYVFDENFFFFFEDIDLCKRVKIMNENIDELEEYPIQGGGGTDFDANWRFMKENEIQPERFIMFTDGYPWDSWGDENYCDTLFIVHGGGYGGRSPVAPFGTTVQYDRKPGEE